MPPPWWLSFRYFGRIVEIAFVAKDVGTFLEHNGTHQTHNVDQIEELHVPFNVSIQMHFLSQGVTALLSTI